jgi:hypothetical protein
VDNGIERRRKEKSAMDPAVADVVIRPCFGIILQHVPIALVSPSIGWSWDPEERHPSRHCGPLCQGCQEKFSCAKKYHQSLVVY